MSTLVENVAKVTAAHAALKNAIAAKGVAVPDGTKLSGMPALVEQIQTEPVPTNPRAVFSYDDATSIVVPKVMIVDCNDMVNLNHCFHNCQKLTTLTLPDVFGNINTDFTSTFEGCSALTSLELPAGFGQNAIILYRTFVYCKKLTSLTLPEGFGQNATNMQYCFSDCSSLTSLTLPEGFGQAASTVYSCFSGCSSLTSLTLPEGFGQAALSVYNCFGGCSSLTSLTLPEGFGEKVLSISNLFYGCSSMTSLELKAGFAKEAKNTSKCFYNCSKITTITGNPNFKVSLDLSPCPNLTHDSIMVVINGLQTVTTTQKLTLGATNLAKLTDEEKKVATDKGWTLA